MGSWRDGDTDTRLHLDDFFSIPLFAPNFASTFDEVPDFLNVFVANSQRDCVWLERAVYHTSPLHSQKRPNLGSVRRQHISARQMPSLKIRMIIFSQ